MKNIFMGFAALSLAAVAMSSPADQTELRRYTWKARTEIVKGGETKNVQLSQMRYDINGALQKTMISSTPQQELPSRGLRGRIAHKKKEDFMETLKGLETLAKSYSEIPADKMQWFMATAVVTQGALLRCTGT